MGQSQMLDWVRGLVAHLRGGGEFFERYLDDLEGMQDKLSAVYDSYENGEPPVLAEVLRELMMEALQLVHSGLEDLLEYAEEPQDSLLQSALASVEEGSDVFDSLRYAIEQDTSWTSSAALG